MSTALKLDPTPRHDLDKVLAKLKSNARAFALMKIEERLALLEQIRDAFVQVMPQAVRAGCVGKGIDPDSEAAGEEWLAQGFTMTRHMRLLSRSLKEILDRGRPVVNANDLRLRENGRLAAKVYPLDALEKLTFPGILAEVYFPDGISRANLHEKQASFYRKPDHEGKVALVLGAGNVPSIPPRDSLTKMFNEGKVVVLKMNPVNEHLGPYIEKAFAAAIDRGYFAVVYGGGDVGAYLSSHGDIDEIHITGSDKTHDSIVWGPPGPEREERKAKKQPLLKKEITSELGNISPVVVIPGPYTAKELEFQGLHVAGMVTNNASFNCNAAKLLVHAKGWDGREKFLDAVEKGLALEAPRKAYYPGAEDRWKQFVEGRANVKQVGQAKPGELPWAVLRDVDPSKVDDKVFTMEPWCSVLSETAVGSNDPVKFLEEVVPFLNDKLWGTLCATFIVHPKTQQDPKFAAAFEKALEELRYGTICVNLWPGAGFGMSTTPWGAHPSSTLENIQSGKGWVFNTFMFDEVEKVIIRAPLVTPSKLPYFAGHKTAAQVARRLAYFEHEPSVLKIPGIAMAAMKG